MVDNYTKAILTIIAVALLGIALKDSTIVSEAKAATGVEGWASIPPAVWDKIASQDVAPPWAPCAIYRAEAYKKTTDVVCVTITDGGKN